MQRKTQLLVLLAGITACGRITGTPAHVLAGSWALREFRGHTLPMPGPVVDSISTDFVGDTLTFDGRGSYIDASCLRYHEPAGPLIVCNHFPGSYRVSGNEVNTRLDGDWYPSAPEATGRRIGNTLAFPADSSTPSELYER